MMGPKSFFQATGLVNPYLKEEAGTCVKGQSTTHLQTLGPHPFLAYTVLKSSKYKCTDKDVGNNVNFVGQDFPKFKNGNEFVILLTGESVAEHFGSAKASDGTYFFEKFLNDRFIPPKGIHFRVISAGFADYRFPQNLIALFTFSDLTDAVIDLSGYNESHNYYLRKKIESPSPNYWAMFDLESQHEISKLNMSITEILHQYSKGNFCSLSYICTSWFKYKIELNINDIIARESNKKARYEPNKEIFKYDNSISEIDFKQHRKSKHKLYYTMFNSICMGLKIKCSFFLQPIPGIGKILTQEEIQGLARENSDRAVVYKELIENVMTLKKEGLDITDLGNVFQHEKGPIYRDHIHYHYGKAPEEPASRGTTLVANSMALAIEKSWHLKRKN